MFVGPSIYHDVYKKDVWVDGTVIAKSGEIVSHYKSTRVTTDYILAVHPDDTEKYTDFDHKVPLATYVKFNVGDKISCKEEAYYVLKNPKWHDDKGVLCIIYIFITLCGIILTLCKTANPHARIGLYGAFRLEPASVAEEKTKKQGD